MSRTRIVILQLREIIYAAVFVGIGILVLVTLFFLLMPGKNDGADVSSNLDRENKIYEAGIYQNKLTLGDAVVGLQVTLDESQVKSVEVINLDESVSAMYPLMKPSVETISNQLASGASVDEVVLSDGSKYTQELILSAVEEIMDEHKVQGEK